MRGLREEERRKMPRENVRGPREDVRDGNPREDVRGRDGNWEEIK